MRLAAEQTNAKLGNSTVLLISTNPSKSVIKKVDTREEISKFLMKRMAERGEISVSTC